MNKKTIVGIALVAMIIAIGGYIYPKGEPTEPASGAVPGPNFLFHPELRRNYTKGGDVVATTTTASAYTLTTNELRREVSFIDWNTGINTTLTTMASTSAPFSNLRVGESFSTYFYSSTSTAAATITFAAGTGVDLQEDEGATVIVNGLEISRLTFLKKSNTDIIFWIEVGQVGD